MLQADPAEYLKSAIGEKPMSDADIDALVAERSSAKQNRDWARADAIRDQLAEADKFEDGPEGTRWRRV